MTIRSIDYISYSLRQGRGAVGFSDSSAALMDKYQLIGTAAACMPRQAVDPERVETVVEMIRKNGAFHLTGLGYPYGSMITAIASGDSGHPEIHINIGWINWAEFAEVIKRI